MSTTTNVSTLKINYLTQSQYDTALSGGQINANEIYLTQAEDMTAQEVNDFVNELEVGGSDGIAVDLVVEQGTSGIWTYRKWSSGIAECWGTASSTSSHYAGPYASFLYGYNYLNLAFPSGLFKSGTRPYAVYGVKVGTAFSIAAANLAVTNTGINLYALANASGSQSIVWDIQVKGRWK